MTNLALGGLLLVVGGCRAPSPTAASGSRIAADLPDARADATAEELRERLAAASRVMSIPAQDGARALVAYDAAASGEVELCLEALQGVRLLDFRDDVAAKAALLARNEGDLAGGRRMAEIIASVYLRDSVMAALAAGVPAAGSDGSL